MQLKKSRKANLENYRSIFLMVGIALSLILVTEIIQWQTEYAKPKKPQDRPVVLEAGINIPLTYPDKPELPKRQKLNPNLRPKISTKLNPVPNNKPVPDQGKIDLGSLNLDTISSEGNVEVPDPVLPIFVQNMARPKNCAELRDKEEQMRCFNQWVTSYMTQEIQYPHLLRTMGVEEKLFMQIIIDELGRVDSVKVMRGEEPEFIAEAKRVLQSMPEFEPATQQGNPVPVKIIIPVNFKLQ